MRTEDKQRILIHYLTRLMAKTMDMSDEQLDKHINLIGCASDVRFECFWDLNKIKEGVLKRSGE